jgi:hypothetical protein
MGAIENFIARSVKDVGADKIVAALSNQHPTRREPGPAGMGAPKPPRRKRGNNSDVQDVIRAAAEAAKNTNGDVELHIEFE